MEDLCESTQLFEVRKLLLRETLSEAEISLQLAKVADHPEWHMAKKKGKDNKNLQKHHLRLKYHLIFTLSNAIWKSLIFNFIPLDDGSLKYVWVTISNKKGY